MGTVAQSDKSQIVLKLPGRVDAQAGQRRQLRGRKPYGFYDGEESVIERMGLCGPQG
jgi:hypothetical protein